MPKLTIDNQPVQVPKGTTILVAAQKLGIKIPTLCYNPHLKPYGGCRICTVEVTMPRMNGAGKLVPACCHPAEEDMQVDTQSEGVIRARRFIAELLLASAPESEHMREVAASLGVDPENVSPDDAVGNYLFKRARKPEKTKCVKCSMCVRVCAEHVGRQAICFTDRGTLRKVKTPFEDISPTCIGCGACAYICPTRAIRIEPAE